MVTKFRHIIRGATELEVLDKRQRWLWGMAGQINLVKEHPIVRPHVTFKMVIEYEVTKRPAS
jgi:hypothetical protein